MRHAMFLSGVVSALVGFGCPKAPEPPVVNPPAKAGALASDGLPASEPERAFVLGQCQICHTSEYVMQQRLTPAQWLATVNKMIGWGAPLSPDQGEALAKVLAEAYPSDAPDYVPPRVDLPRGTP